MEALRDAGAAGGAEPHRGRRADGRDRRRRTELPRLAASVGPRCGSRCWRRAAGRILRRHLRGRNLPVTLVVVDRDCAVADRRWPRSTAVPAVLVERATFGRDFDRLAYTEQVVDVAASGTSVDLVAMAGLQTILEQADVRRLRRRVLNTHPALLPSFPGWHAVADALERGVKVTGCTVHVATLEVDDGPILAQEAVPVLPGDTERRARTSGSRTVERRLYPRRDPAAGRAGTQFVRALLSVYDKTGLVELAAGCADLGWELVSSGGTAAALADAGIAGHRGRPTSPASPRCSAHRVVTLHPKIHGGILADPDDARPPGRHARPRDRAHRPGGREPLPVPGEPVGRADRHRRSGDGAGRGQEPRARRRRRRSRPTTAACSPSCGAAGGR